MAKNRMEPLAELTAQQREFVVKQLEAGVPHKKITAELAVAPPDGFGIVVGHASISRFAKHWKAAKMAEELEEQRAVAARIVEAELSRTGDLSKAALSFLEGKLFDQAMSTSDPKAQRELFRLLSENDMRRERLEISRENLDLSKERSRFNSGRVVMRHFYALKDIHEKRGEDDQAKIEQARDLAFGLLPERCEAAQPNAASLTTEGTESTERKGAEILTANDANHAKGEENILTVAAVAGQADRADLGNRNLEMEGSLAGPGILLGGAEATIESEI